MNALADPIEQEPVGLGFVGLEVEDEVPTTFVLVVPSVRCTCGKFSDVRRNPERSADAGRHEFDGHRSISHLLRVAAVIMGAFKHEAATVDAANGHVYLTEDVADGRLYRFVYENAEDLSAGELQLAEVLGGGPERVVEWRTVPDPSGVEHADSDGRGQSHRDAGRGRRGGRGRR